MKAEDIKKFFGYYKDRELPIYYHINGASFDDDGTWYLTTVEINKNCSISYDLPLCPEYVDRGDIVKIGVKEWNNVIADVVGKAQSLKVDIPEDDVKEGA